MTAASASHGARIPPFGMMSPGDKRSTGRARDVTAVIQQLTTDEVCQLLRISRSTIERARKHPNPRARLKSVRFGRAVRFRETDVRDWQERQQR